MWKIVKYMIPLVIAGKIGGCVAVMEYNAMDINEEPIEPLAERQCIVTDPYDDTRYMIDFERKTMTEYERMSTENMLDDDSLEDIIGGR